MQRLSLAILTFLCLLTTSWAAIGEWRTHNSYQNATHCEVVGNRIFVLSAGSLFYYDKEDSEIHTYNIINSLSDSKIAFISYCKPEKTLLIVYENANIDLLYDDRSIYNISDFKNKNVVDKTINHVNITGSTAHISTSFGIVELNIKKREFSNTYTLNMDVMSSYVYNGYLLAATKNKGLFRGAVKDNLLDIGNWSKLHEWPTKCFYELGNELFCILPDLGIYTINAETGRLTLLERNEGTKFEYFSGNQTMLLAGNANRVVIFHNSEELISYPLDGKSNYIQADGNQFWNCKGIEGLVKCTIKDEQFVATGEGIVPNSPVRNFCEYLQFSSDTELMVAGGNINYFDITFYSGTLMTFNGNKWTNFPEAKIKESTGLNYQNITSIAKKPNEENHYFASSFGYGLYEFKDGEFIKHYNNENSPLQSVVTGQHASKYVRTPRIKYDKDGNLWITNTGVRDIIKVLKNDGSWTSLHYPEVANRPTIVDMVFDSRGWLWLTSMQQSGGLFCAQLNGTPLDTGDDTRKSIYDSFTNQDGIGYTINQLYALCEDKNGMMWIGTDAGLFVLTNPKKFFDSGTTFTQIKVPRNDGTNLADYLLNGVFIQSICVDGANRKWIGTKDNGVYLISEDGTETIHHFATDNSPLPSNNVMSIAINAKSGEVFFGCEGGLVSYTSNATEPQPTLKESSVYAYPNPVKGGYTGNIAINGLTYNCNVKITDSAGSLIHEGYSTGGQYTWNGRNRQGKQVANGVYYVLAIDEEGNEGVATKILVVR